MCTGCWITFQSLSFSLCMLHHYSLCSSAELAQCSCNVNSFSAWFGFILQCHKQHLDETFIFNIQYIYAHVCVCVYIDIFQKKQQKEENKNNKKTKMNETNLNNITDKL